MDGGSIPPGSTNQAPDIAVSGAGFYAVSSGSFSRAVTAGQRAASPKPCTRRFSIRFCCDKANIATKTTTPGQ